MRGAALTLAVLVLSACAEFAPEAAPPETAAPPPPPSAESQAVRSYYARVERELLNQGMLRTERAPPDAPFGASKLAENFMRIALYDELVHSGGRFVQRETESRLRRWEGPIRLRITYGASLADTQRATDSAAIASFAARLSRLSGLFFRESAISPNFDVLILSEDERRTIGPRLRELVPDISDSAVRTVERLDRSTYCIAFAFAEGANNVYTRALIVIRSEHPNRLRLSCIHEEMAQAMGLANDSREARPSIFNDDEEFALLTAHDELLLRLLYDRRLKPGMTAAEARPVVERIAGELAGGES